jgi:hypothetical protein
VAYSAIAVVTSVAIEAHVNIFLGPKQIIVPAPSSVTYRYGRLYCATRASSCVASSSIASYASQPSLVSSLLAQEDFRQELE